MTKTIIIPNSKTIEREEKLVLIPRGEYETLLRIKSRGIPTMRLTPRQRRAIRASEDELRRGDFLTLDELQKHLARPRSSARR